MLKNKDIPLSVILGALVVTVVFNLSTRNHLKLLKTLEVLSLKLQAGYLKKQSNLQHKKQYFAFGDVIHWKIHLFHILNNSSRHNCNY